MLQIKLEIPLRGYNLLPDLRLKNEKEALSCINRKSVPYEADFYFASS